MDALFDDTFEYSNFVNSIYSVENHLLKIYQSTNHVYA